VVRDVLVVLNSAVELLPLVVFCALEVGPGMITVLGVEVELFEGAVDFGSLAAFVSVEQSTNLHRSLQSGRHISVQLVVPPGQPQVHLSVFEL
jgi:hypothetical protein